MDLRLVRDGVQAEVVLVEAVLVRTRLPAASQAESLAGHVRQRVKWPFFRHRGLIL